MESSHPVSLKTLVEYLDNIIGTIGFVLNMTLLYLIIYKTNVKLKDYRPILLQNSLIDTFFNTINIITKTQIDQKNGHFYVYMIGPLANLKHPYNVLFIGLWIFTLFYSLTGIPVQFIYRYLMIVKGINVTFVHYFVLLFSALISALIYACWAIYTFWPDEEDWEAAIALLKADHNYDEGIPNFVLASIEEWPLRILLTYTYFLVTSVYVITIFSNIKVWRHLKFMENQIALQVRDIQRQITMTLILQAAIPCVVCLIPISMAVTMAAIHANVPGLSLILAIFYTITPVANSLVTLIVIRIYRKNILFMFKKICDIRNRNIYRW